MASRIAPRRFTEYKSSTGTSYAYAYAYADADGMPDEW